MIAKLEWTQNNALQNLEQLQNPTNGATINNKLLIYLFVLNLYVQLNNFSVMLWRVFLVELVLSSG